MQPADLLMIPGPTPLPEPVREVLARPAIGHRSPEFKAVLKRVLPQLQWAFQTTQPVLLYSASGTGAMEAALCNTLNPGDRVLVLVCGVFSARWADIASSLGLQVTCLEVPPGQANTLESLRDALEADSSRTIKAVLLTHSETSTGVLNPLPEMAALIQTHGALVIVDAITSLLASPFQFDQWGIDVAVSGSQKGFMLPPGLSFLALSTRAQAAHQQCQNPGFYFNFARYEKAQAEFTTPFTPATPQILALDVALAMMQEEGLEGVWARHQRLRAMTRAGLAALGLTLFVAEERFASHAATAAVLPSGISVADFRAVLKDRFRITVADGQKTLKGKIIRVGHLGYVSERDVLTTLSAIEATLGVLSPESILKPGAAVAQALAVSQDMQQECALHA